MLSLPQRDNIRVGNEPCACKCKRFGKSLLLAGPFDICKDRAKPATEMEHKWNRGAW